MPVLERLARLLTGKPAASAGSTSPAGTGSNGTSSSGTSPEEPRPISMSPAGVEIGQTPASNGPVRIDLHAPEAEDEFDPRVPGPSEMLPVAAPKNRQELLNELQKNYTEVVGLVRKVDQHLDHQHRQSERMMQIAERIPAAVDALVSIRTQNERLADSMDELVRSTREGHDQTEEAIGGQREALREMSSLIAKSNDAGQEMAQSLRGFHGSISTMTGATRDLDATLSDMRERDEARSQELSELLGRSQSWLIAFMVVAVVAIGVAIFLGLAILLRDPAPAAGLGPDSDSGLSPAASVENPVRSSGQRSGELG